jgi:hypothetical protein
MSFSANRWPLRRDMRQALEAQMLATPDQQISLNDPDARSTSGRGSGVVGYNVQVAVQVAGVAMVPKLWRGRATCTEVFKTARDASKATAEVACGCQLDLDRLSRAVGSGQGAGSVGRATDAVGYE